ncbi:hypothetical protein KAZ66_04605 [Candidatus Woesebacteria bacterium]|nr:hypothetical protein [Candidatus Woesebacteria bacterium]
MRYILLLISIFCIPLQVSAEDFFPDDLLPTVATDPQKTLKGGHYQLELSPLEETESAPSKPKITDTLSIKDRNLFNTDGYILSQREGEFKLSISSSRIGLGNVVGNSDHGGDIEIAVDSDTPAAYTLFAIQQEDEDPSHPWSFQPTMCDGEKQTCTTQYAQAWTGKDSYGFGYTISGLDSPHDFKNGVYFRPLRQQFPTILANNNKMEGMRRVKMTYRLRTPPSTQEGVYDTNVDILALPK